MKFDKDQLIRDIAAETGKPVEKVKAELADLQAVLARTTTVTARKRTRREKAARALAGAADFTKSEFERKLDAEAEAEALLGEVPERCAKCGHKFAYCTCGGKVPWDCDACREGRGKGEPIGFDHRYHRHVYADRLCPKHDSLGVPPRNRAERRRILTNTRKPGAPRRTPGVVVKDA